MDKTYRNRSLPVEQRAADLLSRLTFAEKAGQLRNQVINAPEAFLPDGNRAILSSGLKKVLDAEGGVGAVQCLTRCDFWTRRSPELGFTPEVCRDAVRQLQQHAVQTHRLAIPLLLFDDCRHGVPTSGATVFPAGIARGAAWNPELEERIGDAVGAEMAGLGVNVSVGVNLNLARDPRWSRMEECFGEDPFHAGTLGRAGVAGLQRRREDGSLRTAACIHFLCAMGDALCGMDGGAVQAGPALLYTLFRPFAMAAEARAAMASYSSIDGIPCHADRNLLTGMLREQAGFRGVVEADASGIRMMHHVLKLYPDLVRCAAAALRAGVNLDLSTCYPSAYREEVLLQALDRGYLTMEEIDSRVMDVLRLKFELGLFESPCGTERISTHRPLAVEAARQVVTLLANRGDLLPLPERKGGTLALIGPHAFDFYHHLGDYTPFSQLPNLYEDVRGTAPPAWRVEGAAGCKIRTPGDMEEALTLARRADVLVVTLGGSSHRYGQSFNSAGGNGGECADADGGEGIDRGTLELFPAQLELFRALRPLGIPLVAVLIHGRPLCIGEILAEADAVLDLWYPGEGGGIALAEALWGKLNPGGKLPVAIPRHAGQLPIYGNAPRPGRRDYTDLPGSPLLPMGFGLSYTTFSYSELAVSPAAMPPGGTALVGVTVRNSGERTGDEVVQLYLTDEYSSRLRPDRELCGFARIRLAPGESRRVSFEIGDEVLRQLLPDGTTGVEPGDFIFTVGCDAVTGLDCRLTILSTERVL